MRTPLHSLVKLILTTHTKEKHYNLIHKIYTWRGHLPVSVITLFPSDLLHIVYWEHALAGRVVLHVPTLRGGREVMTQYPHLRTRPTYPPILVQLLGHQQDLPFREAQLVPVVRETVVLGHYRHQ